MKKFFISLALSIMVYDVYGNADHAIMETASGFDIVSVSGIKCGEYRHHGQSFILVDPEGKLKHVLDEKEAEILRMVGND